MKVKDLEFLLYQCFPSILAESYDNVGLLVGDPDASVEGILITLDVTEKVIEEAARKKCNVIVAHHPILFNGLKRITFSTYVERVVAMAIRNEIHLIAMHTNADNKWEGVNKKIGEKLGLEKMRILSRGGNYLKKLVTFCPTEYAEKVRSALFEAGAGRIGNYDSCSYNLEGYGTFRALEGSNPFVGRKGEIHREPEVRIEVIFPAWAEKGLVRAMRQAHPYEEPAFDIYPLSNDLSEVGSGMIGELPVAVNTMDFLHEVKKIFGGVVRYTRPVKRKVKKIAWCGGSGGSLLEEAIRQQADVFLTADVKYHRFFDADHKILLADVGHFEIEQFTKELFYELLSEKLPNFALHLSKEKTNPISYL